METPVGAEWDQPLATVPLAFLDCEMTGQDARVDRICELAIRRREGGVVTGELVSLVWTDAKVAGSFAVHGISDAELVAAPSLASLAPRIGELLAGAVVVGHGIAQDLAFLAAAAQRAELPAPPAHALDTLVLARRALHLHGHSLSTLARELSLPSPSHRALPDVRATEALFDVLAGALRPRTARDLWQVRVGERRASMRDDVRAALDEAVATSGRARICYRVPRRAPFVGTMRIERLAPPHVEGVLLETGVTRVLRGDRILWAEVAPSDPTVENER